MSPHKVPSYSKEDHKVENAGPAAGGEPAPSHHRHSPQDRIKQEHKRANVDVAPITHNLLTKHARRRFRQGSSCSTLRPNHIPIATPCCRRDRCRCPYRLSWQHMGDTTTLLSPQAPRPLPAAPVVRPPLQARHLHTPPNLSPSWPVLMPISAAVRPPALPGHTPP